MNHPAPSAESPVRTPCSKLPIVLVFLLLVVFLPYRSPAPIYGFFPGISNLVERADAVVVADIIKKSGKDDLFAGDEFNIRVQKVLKGDEEEGRTYSAYLRDLAFRLTGTNYCRSLFPEGLKPGVRGVFFFKKRNGAEPRVDLYNANCEGDAFAVNPKADLKTVSGLKPRDAVEQLLRDSSAYYGEKFPSYGAAVTNRLPRP